MTAINILRNTEIIILTKSVYFKQNVQSNLENARGDNVAKASFQKIVQMFEKKRMDTNCKGIGLKPN